MECFRNRDTLYSLHVRRQLAIRKARAFQRQSPFSIQGAPPFDEAQAAGRRGLQNNIIYYIINHSYRLPDAGSQELWTLHGESSTFSKPRTLHGESSTFLKVWTLHGESSTFEDSPWRVLNILRPVRTLHGESSTDFEMVG